MDILLLDVAPVTRFTWSLKKWNSQQAKRTIRSIHPLYPIPSPYTGWMNWPINKFYNMNINWRQFFPCLNIHVYYTSIPSGYLCVACCLQGGMWCALSCQGWQYLALARLFLLLFQLSGIRWLFWTTKILYNYKSPSETF